MYYIFVHFVITNHENEYMSNLKTDLSGGEKTKIRDG